MLSDGTLPAATRATIAFRHPGALTSLAVALALLLAVPVIVVLLNVFVPSEGTWAHLAATVLPDYVMNSLGLILGVAYGVITIGITTAWLTTMCRFPGRRVLEWALLLPMAMPAPCRVRFVPGPGGGPAITGFLMCVP
jgi:iron(III) transport system permease protein